MEKSLTKKKIQTKKRKTCRKKTALVCRACAVKKSLAKPAGLSTFSVCKRIFKVSVSALLIMVLTTIQAQLMVAFEAHVVSVIAKIEPGACELGYRLYGYKYFDANQNLIKDDGETGLAGWIIVLNKGPYEPQYDFDNSGYITLEDKNLLQTVVDGLPCPDSKNCDFNNDTLINVQDVTDFTEYVYSHDLGNALTDSDGYYSFSNLEEAAYVIYEVPQAGWLATTEPIRYISDLACGETKVDFGNYQETVEPYCGDGIVNNGEQCDDGNNLDNDGCSANCLQESGQCEAKSIGYWKNKEGCPIESIWTNDVNSLSVGNFLGAFATTTGAEICNLVKPENCASGGTLAGQLCRTQGKALSDMLNIVSNRLNLNALLAGAVDMNPAFAKYGLTATSTVEQAIAVVENVIKDPAHTWLDLNKAAYIAERIYSFYENENPYYPDCIYPGCGNGILEAPEACDDGNLINNDGCSNRCTVEPTCNYICDDLISDCSDCQCGFGFRSFSAETTENNNNSDNSNTPEIIDESLLETYNYTEPEDGTTSPKCLLESCELSGEMPKMPEMPGQESSDDSETATSTGRVIEIDPLNGLNPEEMGALPVDNGPEDIILSNNNGENNNGFELFREVPLPDNNDEGGADLPGLPDPKNINGVNLENNLNKEEE